MKSFSIDAAEPLSSAVSTTTLAPAARHAWACAFCFCGSLSALVIEYVTPAAFRALAKSGASNCTQRTDDFVSGSRTQTWMFAAFFLVLAIALAAITAVTPMAATSSRTTGLLRTFFKVVSSLVAGWGVSEESSSPIMGLESSRKQQWSREARLAR